jgi:glycosyltransferase involved in cell wall biosynthesis
LLKDEPNINFRFIGGKKATAEACAAAVEAGAHVRHEAWLPFEKLPAVAAAASLTLGGPFGGTLQSRFVITGKTYQFLALGKPVLIGQNEVTGLFEDKQNCLMVPQANAEALAETIRWAYHHPKELQQIGHRGRELYRQYFSQTTINQLVQQLLTEL